MTNRYDGAGSRGVIYVATGADYVDLAVRSAHSLRVVEPHLPIVLFSDGPVDGPFDQVLPVPRAHARAKLEAMAATPFQRTLFLDADTRVLAPLDDLFDVLDRFDLALAHDVRRASALIQEGTVKTPYAFGQMNSGVMLYRRSPEMLAFLDEWARRYHADGHVRDQVPLKDLLWESDLRFYVLPEEFNLRRVTMLDAWEPLDARPTILHSHRLMDHMRGKGERYDDMGALVAAERAMLAWEWSQVQAGDDPILRFAQAQGDPTPD
ncbi:putative nucleotide-diphospho-sugar transferase [Aliiroseovarius sp. PTFE2010]|uniref:putative nucleotide-diphospho-sugar transferase n=1 Tax=Aliiroseovarius sp. PTFE2010 TaxID=3417190 RepID=UPI003CEBB93E